MEANYVHKDSTTLAQDKLVKNELNQIELQYNALKQQKFNELLKENQELKKKVEEWEHHLKCSKEMLGIQGQKGNYDYDEYMLWLYNGMEYIISLFETREPNYISGKYVEFTNNKTQQKEFIKYLEDEIKLYENDIQTFSKNYNVYFSLINDLKVGKARTKDILQKYEEKIGVSDENNIK